VLFEKCTAVSEAVQTPPLYDDVPVTWRNKLQVMVSPKIAGNGSTSRVTVVS